MYPSSRRAWAVVMIAMSLLAASEPSRVFAHGGGGGGGGHGGGQSHGYTSCGNPYRGTSSYLGGTSPTAYAASEPWTGFPDDLLEARFGRFLSKHLHRFRVSDRFSR